MAHGFKIDLEDDTPPVHHLIYKCNLIKLEEARKEIEYMRKHGFMRSLESPYRPSVLFAPKKGGGLYFCIDYRWLNKKTVKNKYPLPLLEELFDLPGGSTMSNKIDLK